MPPRELKTYNPPQWSQATGLPVVLGKRRKTWMVPRGFRIAHASPAPIVFVMDRGGVVHALSEHGQHPVPKRLQEPVRRRYFSDAKSSADRERDLAAATSRLVRLASR